PSHLHFSAGTRYPGAIVPNPISERVHDTLGITLLHHAAALENLLQSIERLLHSADHRTVTVTLVIEPGTRSMPSLVLCLVETGVDNRSLQVGNIEVHR